ncbi:nitroreductase family protein [Collinsella sp. UBA1693]|jgi:nitroreductase|uniref:nitroreductase family protein n=1 Tax=Collinsella sp. UBA1693 TaxID=1946385 RepID=UPI002580A439|nr:nitroreductase family protein [Collinsella sp. UBA1693]
MAFSNLTLTRYSCRDYQNRPVEDEKIAQIIEAGRLAPSACNNHPTRVIVCDTPALKGKAAKAAHHFAKDGSVFGAPLVLLVCAKEQVAWTRKYDSMNAAQIDSAIVTDQMMMQAVDLGLQTCWVCHFDPRIAIDEFDLPQDAYPIHMLTVGYAADTIAEPEKREERTIAKEDFLNVRA